LDTEVLAAGFFAFGALGVFDAEAGFFPAEGLDAADGFFALAGACL
jgi:hypothetical protein